MTESRYTARHRSLLRAVAQGRAELTCCRNPDLCVDGLWCDQTAVRELVRDGLLRPAVAVVQTSARQVRAALTDHGIAVLAGLSAAPLAA